MRHKVLVKDAKAVKETCLSSIVWWNVKSISYRNETC